MWHNGLTGKERDGRVTGVTRGDGPEGGEEGKGEGGVRVSDKVFSSSQLPFSWTTIYGSLLPHLSSPA